MRNIPLRQVSLAVSLIALAWACPALAEEAPPPPSASTPAGAAPPPPPMPAAIDLPPAPPVSALPPAPAAKPATPRASPARSATPKTATVAPTVKLPPAPPPEPIKLSDDPRPTLSPQTFTATMQAADQYRAIASGGGWQSVPGDVTRLRPGDQGPAIAALKKRLVVTGDMQPHEMAGLAFDEAVTAGIRRFQARHGLEPTGIVGPRTLVHLNIPASTRVRQLDASAGRLMGAKFPFGERYVVVNIPGAAVEAVERGVVAHRWVAVVGRPERPSPEVTTRITSVNFNPTWTVPVSIIKKDIIPHMRKDPGYLAKMHIRIFDGQGQEIDPKSIDWSTGRAANYTLRQDAGIDNSLGEIRVDMPNRHAVYMHDTPSKRLFSRSQRAQSSGCVRVSGVKGLAAWLLEGSAGPRGPGSTWTSMEIETAIATGSRIDGRLAKSVPVTWIYLTGYASPDGTTHFRDDIYGLDEPKPAAAEPPAPAATPEPAATSSILLPRKQPPRDVAPSLLLPRKQAQREGSGRI